MSIMVCAPMFPAAERQLVRPPPNPAMTQSPQLFEGFVRQRRSLIVVSLALLAFQEIGATLHELNLLGNKVELTAPLPVALPLWVAWFYFVVRYYQYFRDVGDVGLRQVMWKHHKRLAEAIAKRRLASTLRPHTEGFEQPTWTVVVNNLVLAAGPPGWWQFVAAGHFEIRDRANPSKAAMQLFEKEDVALKPGTPRFPRTRGFTWAMLHTRLGTEYGLPFVVAAAPVVREVVRRVDAWTAV